MKEIKLTKDRIALIDDEDLGRVSQYSWYFQDDARCPGRGYTKTRLHSVGSGEFTTLHELVFGKMPGLEIDHQDGNTLNCQKYNLRHCTHAENLRNMKLRRTSSTGVKGVDFHKRMGKYRARICFNYKYTHLGFFHDIALAELAYDLAAEKLYGEFALTNRQIRATQPV
jgi:hypothetical protein